MIGVRGGFSLRPVEDVEAFDAFVASHPYGHLYQGYGWGEVKRQGWVPWRYFLLGPDDIRRGAITLFERRTRLGTSFFYSPRGPCLDPHDGEAWTALGEAVNRFARMRRAAFWRLDPPWAEVDDPAPQYPRRSSPGWTFGGILPLEVWHVPLDGDVLAGVRPNVRRLARRAAEAGVVFRAGGRPDVDWFYDRLAATAAEKGFAVRSRAFVASFLATLAGRGQAELWMAERAGRPLGAALVTIFGRCAEGHYAAFTDDGERLSAHHALQVHLLCHLKERGIAVYDMGGIPLDPTLRRGIITFKSGFGGHLVKLAGEKDIVFQRGAYLLAAALEDAHYRSPALRRVTSWLASR